MPNSGSPTLRILSHLDFLLRDVGAFVDQTVENLPGTRTVDGEIDGPREMSSD